MSQQSLKFQIIAAILVLSLASSAGCRSTATIVKNDDSILEGRITHSDSENVYLERFNRETIVRRQDIREVKHPGRGALLAGAITLGAGLGIGLLGVAVYYDNTDNSRYFIDPNKFFGGFMIIAGSIAGAVGLVLLIAGYASYGPSKTNFDPDGLTLWSPAPGVYLGYQSIIQRPLMPLTENETIHRGKASFRF